MKIDLLNLLRDGESQTVEFKKSTGLLCEATETISKNAGKRLPVFQYEDGMFTVTLFR